MGHGSILPPLASLPGIQHFPSLQFMKEWEVNFYIIGNWDKLVREVTQGWGYAVSNSSFKAQQGVAAWIIKGLGLANCIIGECFAPGTNEDHSSFHSKLAGIYMCLLFTYYCFQHSLPINPPFYLACDGKSVLHWLWNLGTTSPGEPHYDLLSGTCRLLSECGFIFQLAHIKGHQDNGKTMVLT